MSDSKLIYLVALVLIFIPIYPKFPLASVSGSFVAIRLEDFVIAAVSGVWLLTRIGSWRRLASGPLHRAILLYLAIGAIGLFCGVFLTKTATLTQGLLHWLRRVEYLAMFFVSFDLLKSVSQLHFLTRSVILAALIVSLYGLGQQYLGFPVISTTNSEFAKGLALTLGPGARINSTFAGHYDLAAYSVFPLLLIVGLLMTDSKFKPLLAAVGLLIYWTMLLSASRVTFAAFFLTAGLFILVMRRFVWLVPLAVVAVVSILATPQLLGRYREFVLYHLFSAVPAVQAQDLTNARPAVDEELPDALKPPAIPEDRSLNIRLNAEWPRAVRSVLKNPVLGTGYSSVGLATDNDYLRSLAETGILGFLAFGLIILRFLKSSLKFLLSPPRRFEHVFIVAVTFGLVGLLLNAVFIDVFEASKIAIITWMLLGLAEKTKVLLANPK